jgi:alkanesulfonate monooxygenase SsuD/methylene tetrahydromethanopterin reductase-like flavin-dependent oxidoreductase (luciferase family)
VKVGLMLPLGHNDALGRSLTWPELRAMAQAADSGGLDAVWAADHLLFREHGQTYGIHECWTILTAVAGVTQRVTIGPLVLALAFRNPGVLAKMAVALDEISNGRLILGVGCGWHEPEFTAFDYPFDHRVGRFEEALEVLVPLLRTGRVTFEGQWQRADAELIPRGPRPNGPPILIAGKQPRMMRLVARHADQWNAAWYGLPEEATELAERIERQRAACQAEGRDPATLELTAGIFVAFPHLLAGGDGEEPPKEAIRGDVEHVAEAMAGYAQHGIEHVIVHVWPRSAAAVEELARAAVIARRIGAPVESAPA